jgi:hypothetical protein
MEYRVITDWKELMEFRKDYYEWYESDMAKKDFEKAAHKYGYPYVLGLEGDEVHYYKMTELYNANL